jgi:hypothetical protein
MNSAGIAADQQQYADELIKNLSNWQYETTVNNGNGLDLCNAEPPSKIAIFGSDYSH